MVENTNDITLHLPDQTFDEFNRNRETKIADALKRFNEEKLTGQFPVMCKNYPEYSKIISAIDEFKVQKSKLLESLNKDIESFDLKADKIVASLFEHAERHEYKQYMLFKAKERFDLGKPPGKNKSYGDAINWVTLLENIPNGEDLYFISDDKDFYSVLNATTFKRYLTEEWENVKKSKLFAYRRISDFFKDKFPEIKFTMELEKDILIQELSGSRSFATTRRILKKLCLFEDFSITQLNEFLTACTHNTQIHWIGKDYDIVQMIRKILDPHLEKLDSSLLYDFDSKFKYYRIYKEDNDVNFDETERQFGEDYYGELKY
jgi:hypothetical protein